MTQSPVKSFLNGGEPSPPPPARQRPVPKPDPRVRELLAHPTGTILADRFGRAVQRMESGAYWVLGEKWPHLASEIVDLGPFEVLRRPGGAP